VEDLDGDNLFHVFARAQGTVDGAHAADADGFEDAVLGEAAGGVEGGVGGRSCVRKGAVFPGGVGVGRGGGAEEFFDFGAERRVARGVGIEEGSAPIGGQGCTLFEEALDLFKPIQCISATKPLRNSSRVRLCE
jgi:hypothetical protein